MVLIRLKCLKVNFSSNIRWPKEIKSKFLHKKAGNVKSTLVCISTEKTIMHRFCNYLESKVWIELRIMREFAGINISHARIRITSPSKWQLNRHFDECEKEEKKIPIQNAIKVIAIFLLFSLLLNYSDEKLIWAWKYIQTIYVHTIRPYIKAFLIQIHPIRFISLHIWMIMKQKSFPKRLKKYFYKNIQLFFI